MASGREIVTLQFGCYSNFIGTHWWNLQAVILINIGTDSPHLDKNRMKGFLQQLSAERTGVLSELFESRDADRLLLLEGAPIHTDWAVVLSVKREAGFVYNADSSSEINHDILFREGVTSKGYVTYTPRLLLVDLKGSLRHLRQEGDLYNHTEDVKPSEGHWPVEKVDVVCTPKGEKNEFLNDLGNEENAMDSTEARGTLPKVYNLDSAVNVWADYLRARYHPRTVSLISEYEHNSDTKPFDVFNYGADLWKTEQFQDDFTDRIRMYVEECDNMQGFHILLDGSDGFAGLGTSAVEYLEDEYSTKSKLVFPSIPSEFSNTTPLQDNVRMLNITQGFHSLAEHSCLFVPLCLGSSGWKQPGVPREFPHLRYNRSLAYHSSAILAAALDTATLRYRLRTGTHTCLSEITNTLSRLGRRVAVASLGLPFAMGYDAYLLDTLEKWEGPLWQTLSPGCNLQDDRIWMQSVVLRGVPEVRLRSAQRDGRMKQEANPAYTCTSIQEMLSLFLSCCSYATASNVTSAYSPCNVTSPFPQIFSEFVGLDGSVSAEKRPETLGVYSVPAIAGLHSCRSAGKMLEDLHLEVKKLQLKRFHYVCNSGLEEDDYQECLNHLALLRECYHEEFDV